MHLGPTKQPLTPRLQNAGEDDFFYFPDQRHRHGERHEDEIRNYSAKPRHYLTSSRRSALYGAALYPREHGELDLFPGTVPLIIGAAAFVPPLGPLALPAAAGLIASVDASFGLRGAVYSWLDKLPPFRGFRVAARFRAVAGLYLALLGGIGVGRLARLIRPVWPRRLAVSAIAVAVLVDVHPSLELQPLWTHGPDVYARVPDGRVLLRWSWRGSVILYSCPQLA